MRKRAAGYEADMNPTTRVIASFPDYADAQRAVDGLADHHFAVDRLAIVGAGLQSFEQVTGRRGYGRAATEGLLSGAVIGAVIGWLLGLFSLVEPLVSALLLGLWGLVLGAVLGAALGAIGHATTRGERDFSSVSTVRAERYDLVCDAEVADDAQRVLASLEPTGPGART
jgi:hypothetical protein